MTTAVPTAAPTADQATIDELGERIAETAAVLDATEHTLLTDIREFDAIGGWHRQGALSCAHWLSWRIGLALPAAREKVRVGRALADLPLIDDALRAGSISYSKVRAMTRVATSANEAELLSMARHSTAAELERICRLLRGVQTDPVTARAAEDRRWVRRRATDDGLVKIEALLPAEEAELVLKAIDVSAEDRDRADGLVAMAEATVRGDAPNRSPVDVTVHVDAATLLGHFDDGTAISAETSRRLCCDAGIVPMLDDADGKPLDVGRKTRAIPPALRRALLARDGGCQFPGCTHRRFVDAHHVVHWADDGETSLGNTLLLCRRHHVYVHEYGYTIERSDAGVVVRDPGGEVVPTTWVRPARHYDTHRRFVARWRSERGIDAETNLPGWDGRPPDYGRAVAALL